MNKITYICMAVIAACGSAVIFVFLVYGTLILAWPSVLVCSMLLVLMLVFKRTYNGMLRDLGHWSAEAARLYPVAAEWGVKVNGLRVAFAELAAKLPDIDPDPRGRAVRVESSSLVVEYRALNVELAEAEARYAEAVMRHNLVAEQFNSLLESKQFKWSDEGETKMQKRILIPLSQPEWPAKSQPRPASAG